MRSGGNNLNIFLRINWPDVRKLHTRPLAFWGEQVLHLFAAC